MHPRKADLFHKPAGSLEFLPGLPRESDHDVGGQGTARERLPQPLADPPVLVGGIAAPHAGEGGVAPALQGQMKLGAEAAAAGRCKAGNDRGG